MLIFIFIYSISAVIFRDDATGMFLGKYNEEVVMVPTPLEALDLSLQDTQPPGVGSILSLGIQALSVDGKVDLSLLNRNDKRQFFKVILTGLGTYIFQHESKCLGYSRQFAYQLGGFRANPSSNNLRRDFRYVEMVDCDDVFNVIKFLKSDRIDGEIRKEKIVTYADNGFHNEVGKEIVREYEEVKPESTGFLKGFVDRVTHLF